MWVDCQLGAFRTPTNARLVGISDGQGGAVETMRYMRELVRDAVRDPSQKCRELALQIIPSSAYIAQIRAIQQWVQTHIKYVQDPPDVELVQTPQKTVDYGAGDCDDQSVLVCALLTSIGHPCRLIAIGLQGGPLSHVLSQTKVSSTGNDAKDWCSVETIIAKPLGWFPSGVTSRYILKI